jgi:DNA-binding CsgD family transcriptional regulator
MELLAASKQERSAELRDRAVSGRSRIPAASECACAYQQVLDMLGLGVLVLDGSRNVVYGNIAGRAAADTCGLSIRGRTLRPKTQALGERIDAAFRRAVGGSPVLIRLDHDGGAVHWLFHPYGDRGSATSEAGVIVLVRMSRPSRTVRFFSETYALSPAEHRVLCHLVAREGSVKGVARSAGITVSTVRSHLKSLFQKTRTRRQSELLSLVWSLPAPPFET